MIRRRVARLLEGVDISTAFDGTVIYPVPLAIPKDTYLSGIAGTGEGYIHRIVRWADEDVDVGELISLTESSSILNATDFENNILTGMNWDIRNNSVFYNNVTGDTRHREEG